MRKPFIPLLILAVMGIQGASTQGDVQAELSALSVASFPTITASLDIYDSAGNFVPGLTNTSVIVLEDDQTRAVDVLQELQPGVQFVVALDPGATFAKRFIDPGGKAITRFEQVVSALEGWAASLPDENVDDLNLVATGGPSTSHLADTAAFIDALDSYQPDMGKVIPSLETLSIAISMACEGAPRPDMKRAVLYIAPPLEAGALGMIESLIGQAREGDVRVYVWIVASEDFFLTSGATALRDLAIQTGGAHFSYSGAETLPSPEEYLSPLRHIYHLSYTSGITTSGEHTLMAQAIIDGQLTSATPLTFEVDVQPPNPFLVSPPEQIVRQVQDPNTTDLAALEPAEQPIEVIIEFPDGHPRGLARTVLYVDGVPADENTSEPFDHFVWDLREYTKSGQHSLQVEAVDILGLSQIGLAVPVTVTVIRPRLDLQVILTRNSLWVTLGALLLAGGILAAILTWHRVHRLSGAAGSKREYDPLTQSVLSGRQKRGLQLPWKPSSQPASAHLIRLRIDGEPMTSPPIPLTGAEITFGSDPLQATRVLDDPSVSPLHARLKMQPEGAFTINDEKSVAGTWVNYEPLGREPHLLQHGDVIQIGQLSYRFMLLRPPEKNPPRLLPPDS